MELTCIWSSSRKTEENELSFYGECNFYIYFLLFFFSGVLKDYFRELPEPLVTNALYQMLLDALSVRLPSDPDGSAKLMLSILECLPKANQVEKYSGSVFTNHSLERSLSYSPDFSIIRSI